MKPETHPEFEASEVKSENNYSSYKNLGGIINEGDYASVLARVPGKVKEFTDMSEMLKAQAEAGTMITVAQHEDLQKLSVQMTPVKMMADAAGVSFEADEALENVVGTELGVAVKLAKDPRVALYRLLRGDTNTSGEEYHHSQMSDRDLFVEVLRMSGDEESLKKLAEAQSSVSSLSKEKKE